MTQSPRLLILITDLERGGTPTIVRELSTRLAKRGHQVEVACLSTRGPVADEIEQLGVQVTALGATGIHSLGIVPRLIRLIRERQITTVYSLLVHANTVAAIASLFCRGIKFVQSIQTTQPNPRWHWRIQSIAQHAAENVIVPSPSAAEIAQHWAGVEKERIIAIPNAVDAKDFVDPGRTFNSTPPFSIGFIGRLDPVKRVPDLIEAASILGPAFHVHIYGEGPDRPRIEALIKRLALSNVTLHGAIPRPQDALAEIDLLVLPSQAEGFGLVLIEAMAAKIPVVATNAPGIRDVVRHNTTGLLVPIGSPPDLAAAITRIQSDRQLRETLVEHAYADVLQRFDWEPVITDYEKILF